MIVGSALDKVPVWQAISFAILGAFLQTAVLGLIYEVFLRNEVEDATLEKLGTARDVREHGLVKLGREANIDWSQILEATSRVCIVANDPKSLLGRFDDQVMRRAAEGYLDRVTIVVPEERWKEAEGWLTALRDKWERTAPAAELFVVKSTSVAAYEFIGTDSTFIILRPSLSDAPGIEATKLLDFKRSEPWGIGSWLSRQTDEIIGLQPTIGHSPPPPPVKVTPIPPASSEPVEVAESEELT